MKRLGKYFIFLFLVSFLAVNWNEISPFFNYHFISAETNQILSKIDFKKEAKAEAVVEWGTIEIPKIGVSAPIVFLPDQDLEKSLERGVVYFPLSELPGKWQTTILLGHSAPLNWPKINYEGVFSRLEDLENGDEIFIEIAGQKYIYQVSKKIFLDVGEDIPEKFSIFKKSSLYLISCWPPGKNFKRISVEAELKK